MVTRNGFNLGCVPPLITKEEGVVLFEDMVLGRAFEDMCAQIYYRGGSISSTFTKARKPFLSASSSSSSNRILWSVLTGITYTLSARAFQSAQ
ncbi:hypothetical protein MLD38_010206 [Melastoma candidum]|uniref:Uncharacterized protein n=1 Tax=Melastoma candidum TaxID=119954 RepID=A0ACB9QZ37_9MYRT|nr:hypothetical protein MLD38_010206 [Melastoma candidum]